MMKKTLFAILFFAFLSNTNAQIINGLDTLYGNEWINFSQSYFKILLAEDGIYRVNGQVLSDAGIPLTNINGNQFQVFHNGEEIPIYTTTDGPLSNTDYIEFYGQKNTSELDRYLFKNPDEEMMNPKYSLFTDTAAYFLTWKTQGFQNLRFINVQNDITNPPPKENYYIAELTQNYFSQFRKKADSQGISSSHYGVSEGYASNLQNSQTFTITPTNVYSSNINGLLNVRYAGNSGSHKQEISINGQVVLVDEYYDFEVRKPQIEVLNNLLGSPISLKFLGLTSNSDNQRISNITLQYPRLFKFDNQSFYTFEIAANSSTVYLEIENFAVTGIPVLYDITNNIRITAVIENNVVKVVLPPSLVKRKLVLINNFTGSKPITVLTPVQFIDYKDLNAQFIILSNPKLYDDGNGVNYVQEYANYRSSAAGGGFSTVIVDVQQLYDQFGWGLNRHPLSIRSFGHFVEKNWPSIKYFFAVGKGREYTSIRSGAQLASATSYYVPTFGLPGADNLLLSTNQTSAPIFPFGRLAASTPEDVNIFLKKVIDFEANASAGQTIEERQWMKNIIHLGGGGSALEQSSIRNYLSLMGNIVSNNQFGGNVTSFFKSSTDPIQVSKSQQIFERINKGVSIITFMGHSAVGTFDFNIDNPDNYQNFAKYPVIFSLGCYSGNIHTAGLGIGERFVFQKDKAAIGMVATSGQGYGSALYSIMSKFYENLGGAHYQKSMGVLLQKTIESFDGTNFTQRELLEQFTYLGDPAIKVFAADGPDLLIDAASVNILPKTIHIRQDSFTLQFKLVNIGKNTEDSISVKIEHELPDGNRFIAANLVVKSPAYSNTYEVKLSTIGKIAVGRNKLYISADATDIVAELPMPAAEMNNELVDASGQKGVWFFITDNGATPVYPSDFAIVGDVQVALRASTSDPLAPMAKYIIEIDTTMLFNSPLKKNTTIEQTGGLIEWKPDLSFVDEKVYYWRISPDSLSAEVGYDWDNRSFTYIAGSPWGWSQRHYWQFLEDRYNDMKLEAATRKFTFLEDFKDFRINNKVFNVADQPKAYINGIWFQGFFRWDMNQSIHIAVFDTLGREWRNPVPGIYGSVNLSAPNPIPSFPFSVETVQDRQKIIDFLSNIVPPNFLVFVYTAQKNLTNNLNISQWQSDSILLNGKNIFNVLESYGATHIRDLETNLTPYVFAFVKDQNVVVEKWAELPTGEINFELPIQGIWYYGNVESTIIGPSKKWEKFTWEYDNSNVIDKDTFYVDIYGVSANQMSEVRLFEKELVTEIDLHNINVDSFPYLRLEFYAKDSIDRSPVQLKNWNVLYQGMPDAAFNPMKGFLFHRDTLVEGDNLRLESYVTNTNGLAMDSLLIRYEIRDKAGNLIQQDNRVDKLLPDGDINLSFSHLTKGLAGDHQLLVQLNPDDDQPELFSFNNFLLKDFYVLRDRRNPLLDVTFDGVHILDGDIVSPKPEISIALKDENPFLLLEDTSSYKLFLLLPNGNLQGIPLNGPAITFQPATSSSDTKALLKWRPEFAEGGDYALIVQATDATGNNAGAYDFKVSFKVILETMLSNVLAYPNPFSTATRFVYTLTGEPPTEFKIQIMTISGRIVREMTQDELGPLKIGTHQTEFVWDGTDEFGDRLANGIYLYRVLAKDSDNQDYKLFETGADGFFNKGFGKLAIIR